MASKNFVNQKDLETGNCRSKNISLLDHGPEDTASSSESKCYASNCKLILKWATFAALLIVVVVIVLKFTNDKSSSLLTQASVAADELEDAYENIRNLEDFENHMNQEEDTLIYDVMENVKTPNIGQPLIPQDNDQHYQLSSLEIKHVQDLKNMKSSVRVVTIQSLIGQDRFSPESFQLPQTLSPVALTINGPISTMWLKEIVEKLPNMRNLTLDMNKLCSMGRRIGNGKHPQITFINVLSFKIENSHKTCNVQQWVLNLKFPKLANLEIHSMNLNKEVFGSVHQFLDEHKSTLKTIKVTESYICDDCFFSDVDYRDIQMVTILRQKDQSFK